MFTVVEFGELARVSVVFLEDLEALEGQQDKQQSI